MWYLTKMNRLSSISAVRSESAVCHVRFQESSGAVRIIELEAVRTAPAIFRCNDDVNHHVGCI